MVQFLRPVPFFLPASTLNRLFPERLFGILDTVPAGQQSAGLHQHRTDPCRFCSGTFQPARNLRKGWLLLDAESRSTSLQSVRRPASGCPLPPQPEPAMPVKPPALPWVLLLLVHNPLFSPPFCLNFLWSGRVAVHKINVI